MEPMGTESTDCVSCMGRIHVSRTEELTSWMRRTTVEKDRLGREHLRMNFHV